MSMIGKYDEEVSPWMKLCYKVMRSGKIPQHVAFIMDGNRRYAKKESISRKDGHSKGFDKLTEVRRPYFSRMLMCTFFYKQPHF